LFAGLGTSHLSAWLYQSIQERTGSAAVPLLVEAGMYDFKGEFGDSYVFSTPALPTASMLADTPFALDRIMQSVESLSILTGAQIDRDGNVNSNRIGGTHFVGSGGANDALTLSTDVILVVEASPKRLRPDLEFITGPGENVTQIVTQYGVLARNEDGNFEIAEVFTEAGTNVEERTEELKEVVGWDVHVRDDVAERKWEPKHDEFVEILRNHDPTGDYRA